MVHNNLKDADKADYRPFSLIIIDFNMPFLNGLEVIRKLKEICWRRGETHPPSFMMHTSNQEKEFRDTCALEGIEFFAEKPIKEERLANALSKLGFIEVPEAENLSAPNAK